MAWARIDDGILDHPKVLEAGEDARDLLIASIIWCNKHLTDGRIPKAALSVLTRKKSAKKTVSSLILTGLWRDEGDAWRIHDFLDWNPSRSDVEAQRAASAERMRRSRERKAQSSPPVAPQHARNERATSPAVAAPTPLHSSPDPDPREDPPCSPPATQGDAPAHVVEIREAGKRGRAKRKAKPAPSPEAVRVLTRMAELSGCRYEASPALEARLREGVPVEDCLAVVEHLARDPWWLEKRFAGPEAPFRRDKFPGYLAQARAAPLPADEDPYSDAALLRKYEGL